MPDNEELFFSLIMHPKIVDRSKLDDPVNEINELGIDLISNANPIIFHPKKQTCSDMLNELFNNGSANGQ